MDLNYKIEVSLSPNDECSLEPYFWCLFSNNGNNWCNSGFGWAASPEAAWIDAYEYYKLILKVNSNEV